MNTLMAFLFEDKHAYFSGVDWLLAQNINDQWDAHVVEFTRSRYLIVIHHDDIMVEFALRFSDQYVSMSRVPENRISTYEYRCKLPKSHL